MQPSHLAVSLTATAVVGAAGVYAIGRLNALQDTPRLCLQGAVVASVAWIMARMMGVL